MNTADWLARYWWLPEVAIGFLIFVFTVIFKRHRQHIASRIEKILQDIIIGEASHKAEHPEQHPDIWVVTIYHPLFLKLFSILQFGPVRVQITVHSKRGPEESDGTINCQMYIQSSRELREGSAEGRSLYLAHLLVKRYGEGLVEFRKSDHKALFLFLPSSQVLGGGFFDDFLVMFKIGLIPFPVTMHFTEANKASA